MTDMVADARRPTYPSRSCSDTFGHAKVGYPTRRYAQKVRRAKGVMDQHVYQCPVCCFWHLGHRRQQGEL